jgi:hypothetical protein
LLLLEEETITNSLSYRLIYDAINHKKRKRKKKKRRSFLIKDLKRETLAYKINNNFFKREKEKLPGL